MLDTTLGGYHFFLLLFLLFFSFFRRAIFVTSRSTNESIDYEDFVSRNEILARSKSWSLWMGGSRIEERERVEGTFVCTRKWNVESWFVANTGYVNREFVARLIRLPVSKQPRRYVATQFVVSRGHPRRANNWLCLSSSLVANILEKLCWSVLSRVR